MTNCCFKFLQLVLLLSLFVHAGNCKSTRFSQSKQLKLLYYTASNDGSHHLMSTKIAETLVKRGHDVTFLLSNSCTKWRNASDAAMFKFVVHKSLYTPGDRERNLREMSRLSFRGDLRGIWRTTKFTIGQIYLKDEEKSNVLFDFHVNECDSLLGDSETIRVLKEEKFDMLVGEDLSDCQPLLAEILGIRFVLIGVGGTAPSKGSWYGVPRHPAYIPERQTGLTDSMNLLQRMKNTYMYLIHDFARRAALWKFEALQKKYGLRPGTSLPEMLAEAQLWLVYGVFGLDFARPLQPNVVFLASPLLGLPSDENIPRDQQEFLDAADEGVVLFTMGGNVNEMETAQAQMFANGLAKLSQRVIWQFSGNLSHVRVGNNTKIVKWMSQQKLMEHRNTKVFLNHGGLNGLHEAAWYGLPMVGVPLFGDHFDNMERAVAKGMALQLDITTLTEDILSEAVTRVIKESRFRERAQHISHILRDQPVLPAEKAAHWIAHVGRYDGGYLRPGAVDLTWIELHLVDVYAFLGAIVFGALGALYLGFKGCLWLVCGRKRREKLKVN